MEVMCWKNLCLSAVALVGLRADTLTLAAGSNYVAAGSNGALTVTTNAANATTFERLYAGNGFFYLRVNGRGYVTTNAASGALSIDAPNTAEAEEFQANPPSGASATLAVRSTSGYVEVTGSTVVGNALNGEGTTFTLTMAADATPMVEVDFDNPRQKIAGFGAADAFFTNWLTAHPNKEQIYALLFGRDALGASFLRVQDIYGQSSSTPFDPDTAEVVAKANAYRGSPIAVLMTSWSPPAALKASLMVNCNGAQTEPGCTLAKVNGAYNYAGFAQYWYDSLNAYAALGVKPTYISLQNEPDFTPSAYAGCRFDPTEQPGGIYAGYKQALDAVYTKLQGMIDPPEMIGPEVVGLGYNIPENYLSALNGTELDELDAFAHHLYHGGDSADPDSYDGSMLQLAGAASGKTLFETEFDHSSDQKNALETAWLIHDAMSAEEASTYLYWSLFWPDTNQLIYIDNPFNQPSSWVYPSGYHINDYYYALQHFSRFVQPGFQRIASPTGLANLRATAYYSARDGRLVFVLINTSTTATLSPTLAAPMHTGRRSEQNLTADSQTADPSQSGSANDERGQYNATAVYRSTFSGTSERFAYLGPLAASGLVTLPAESVATVVIDGVTPPCGAFTHCRALGELLGEVVGADALE